MIYDAFDDAYGYGLKTRESLERKLRAAEDLRARLIDQIAQLEQYGEDIFDNGAVVTFEKRFTPSSKVYNYAAIKAGGFWHLTGRETRRFTWDDLIAFVDGGELWYAESWEQV